MTPDNIHKLLQEMHIYTKFALQSFYELGKRAGDLKKAKAHKIMGCARWDEFIASYTNYSVSYVDFCIIIAEKFGGLIEKSPTKVGISFDRLREVIPLIKTEKDAEHWYHQAETLPIQGWRDAIKVAQGRIPSDQCEHSTTELWQKCTDKCKAWLGKYD